MNSTLVTYKNLILEIFSKQTFNVENLTIAVVTGAICCLDYCSFPFTDLCALYTNITDHSFQF